MFSLRIVKSLQPSFRGIHRSLAMNVPKFSYGESSFKSVNLKGRFCSDKTSLIKVLEESGTYVKICRPRRFGKTFVCNMLEQYYDAANSKDEVILFIKTKITIF